MLRPHDGEDAELCHARLAAHDLQHQLVFLVGEAVLRNDVRRDLGGRSGHESASTMLANSALPSVEPCSGSIAFSGCGIRPSTFLVRLKMPAMLRADPLGLASSSSP